MPQRPIIVLALAVMSCSGQSARKVSTETPGYDFNYIGPRMADPVLQHSKETYVLFGCSYCHGLYLISRGEATDLLHSRLVGRDEDANLIGPLLRAGIPQTAKLSPMPQFSDLSEQQINDITRWIHYARQQERYKELTEAATVERGDAAAGKVYFESACVSCHSADNLPSVKKYTPALLRAEILKPHALEPAASSKLDRVGDTKTETARQRHLKLLENYSSQEVANLVAYLK